MIYVIKVGFQTIAREGHRFQLLLSILLDRLFINNLFLLAQNCKFIRKLTHLELILRRLQVIVVWQLRLLGIPWRVLHLLVAFLDLAVLHLLLDHLSLLL